MSFHGHHPWGDHLANEAEPNLIARSGILHCGNIGVLAALVFSVCVGNAASHCSSAAPSIAEFGVPRASALLQPWKISLTTTVSQTGG
jgi:hypothetical protein